MSSVANPWAVEAMQQLGVSVNRMRIVTMSTLPTALYTGLETSGFHIWFLQDTVRGPPSWLCFL